MQVHVVSYFRYFRFFEDGSIISVVYPNKQKLNLISDQLTQNVLTMDPMFVDKNVMIGEYLQHENSI